MVCARVLCKTIFLFFAMAASPILCAQTSESDEIHYDDAELQTLEVFYLTDSAQQRKPVHVFIHGGAWRMGDKERYDDMGAFYVERGAVFVSVNYRLYPDDLHPAQVEDCAAAVAWVVKNIERYGGDKNKIYISGHSAGAHLSALLASDPHYLKKYEIATNFFKGVFPVDTASFDFTKKTDTRGLVVRMVNNTIKNNFGPETEKLKQASPVFQAPHNPNLPAFTLFVTSKRPGAVEQTKAFAEVLKQSNAPSNDVHVIKGLSHREMALAMYDVKFEVARTILEKMGL